MGMATIGIAALVGGAVGHVSAEVYGWHGLFITVPATFLIGVGASALREMIR